MVKVSVLLSAAHSYLDASHGVVAPLFSALTKTSGSYTTPTESVLSEGLNGLNPQVHSPPLALEMVTVPPIFPLPDDEVFPLEEEEHAAARASTAPATTATRMRFIVRFIVTALRSSTRSGATPSP